MNTHGDISNGSGGHSTHPSAVSSPHGQQHSGEKLEHSILQSSSEPISLEGIVDLSNTVDTTVTTKHLPAVTHEKVIPTQRETREEVITREIHTHDVFHRILPVIETVILPTKHYIPTPDGKGLVEVPESMIPGRTALDSPSRNWEIVPIGIRDREHSILSADTHDVPRKPSSVESVDDGNVVGGKSLLEPVLSSKKTYMTKEGYPRTEYVWRHPPVFETANGQIQYIFQGVERYINGEQRHGHSRRESDVPRSDVNFSRKIAEGDLHSRFNRDSGYGDHNDSTSHVSSIRNSQAAETRGSDSSRNEHLASVGTYPTRSDSLTGHSTRRVNETQPPKQGEATSALRRIREKRSQASSMTSTGVDQHTNGNDVGDVERGMKSLDVNN